MKSVILSLPNYSPEPPPIAVSVPHSRLTDLVAAVQILALGGIHAYHKVDRQNIQQDKDTE